jgi:FdhE protein
VEIIPQQTREGRPSDPDGPPRHQSKDRADRIRPSESDLSIDLGSIEASLDRARQDLPALISLLNAVGPLLLERARLRHEAPGWKGPAPELEENRFGQGVFLLSDSGFQDMSSHLSQAARRLLPLMARSFSGLAAELNVLLQAIDSGEMSPQDLAAAGLGGDLPNFPIRAEVLRFAAVEMVRPFVERQARDLVPTIRALPWRRGLCPVCGGLPYMSLLRRTEDENDFIRAYGGRRFLRCSGCATEWEYNRVSCPACGCDEPDELEVLRDPARPHERADACRRCHIYLPDLDTADLIDPPHPDVAFLTMVPLALQVGRRGYRPLVELPWNCL